MRCLFLFRARPAQVGFNLGVDPRKPGQNLRGAISLPHGNGKKVTIAVMARKEKVRRAAPLIFA